MRWRLALVREGDQHAPALAEHPRELRLGLREPSCCDCGALGLEPMRLGVWEGVELGGALERDRLEPVLLPHAPDVRRLPDEVGRAGDGWNEIVGDDRPLVVETRLGRELGLDEVAPALRSRVDHRLVDRVQRALRERRERAHLLDLVAEELDAKRLAARAREDVDEAAANGDLTALLHAIDARVAGQSQRLDERVEASLVADGDPERLRSPAVRRHAFRERPRRRGDEAPGGEHVERAGALPDEVSRRLQTRPEGHAAARQECDPRGIEVPPEGFGGVARVLVLGQDREEAAIAARLVKRGEHERQRRVGHARRRGKRVRERAKLLALGEHRDERVKR